MAARTAVSGSNAGAMATTLARFATSNSRYVSDLNSWKPHLYLRSSHRCTKRRPLA